MSLKYMKNHDGVHAMNPLANEFSLCGDAFDVECDAPEAGDMTDVKAQTVTCKRCREVITSILREFKGRKLK